MKVSTLSSLRRPKLVTVGILAAAVMIGTNSTVNVLSVHAQVTTQNAEIQKIVGNIEKETKRREAATAKAKTTVSETTSISPQAKQEVLKRLDESDKNNKETLEKTKTTKDLAGAKQLAQETDADYDQYAMSQAQGMLLGDADKQMGAQKDLMKTAQDLKTQMCQGGGQGGLIIGGTTDPKATADKDKTSDKDKTDKTQTDDQKAKAACEQMDACMNSDQGGLIIGGTTDPKAADKKTDQPKTDAPADPAAKDGENKDKAACDQAGGGGGDQQKQLELIMKLLAMIAAIAASVVALITALKNGDYAGAAAIFASIVGQLAQNLSSILSAQSDLQGMADEQKEGDGTAAEGDAANKDGGSGGGLLNINLSGN